MPDLDNCPKIRTQLAHSMHRARTMYMYQCAQLTLVFSVFIIHIQNNSNINIHFTPWGLIFGNTKSTNILFLIKLKSFGHTQKHCECGHAMLFCHNFTEFTILVYVIIHIVYHTGTRDVICFDNINGENEELNMLCRLQSNKPKRQQQKHNTHRPNNTVLKFPLSNGTHIRGRRKW